VGISVESEPSMPDYPIHMATDTNTYVAETLSLIVKYAVGIMRAEGAAVLDVGHMNAALGVAGLQQMPDVVNVEPEVTMVEGRFRSTLNRQISPWIHSNIEAATLNVMGSGDPVATMKNLFSDIGEWTSDFVIKSLMRRLTNDNIREAIECGASRLEEGDLHPKDERKYVRINDGRYVSIYDALEWILRKIKGYEPWVIFTELVPVIVSRLVMDSSWVDDDRRNAAKFIALLIGRCPIIIKPRDELWVTARRTTLITLKETAADSTLCWQSRCGALLGLSVLCDAPCSIYAGIVEPILTNRSEYERRPGEDLMSGHVTRAMYAHVSYVTDTRLDKTDTPACEAFTAHATTVSECFGITLAEWLACGI
jgi:hypothetical protein